MGLTGHDWGNGRKGKRKKERKKRMLFSIPRKVASLSPGKRKKSPETQCFQGIRRKKREKEEERDGFRIRFLRGIQGKKDGRKEGRRKERMLFFSLSGGLFSLQKKEEIQWFQGKEKGKKKEKKDEVDGLEDGIFRGRLEEWEEKRKEGRRP